MTGPGTAGGRSKQTRGRFRASCERRLKTFLMDGLSLAERAARTQECTRSPKWRICAPPCAKGTKGVSPGARLKYSMDSMTACRQILVFLMPWRQMLAFTRDTMPSHDLIFTK